MTFSLWVPPHGRSRLTRHGQVGADMPDIMPDMTMCVDDDVC
ncbi:MAG: hypothetical protein FD149_2665 [Rhodospirillaceae bacterium]|nr:MAG: hypothetical protein FD149_2665 [Rhodospirillaceae bacterium]